MDWKKFSEYLKEQVKKQGKYFLTGKKKKAKEEKEGKSKKTTITKTTFTKAITEGFSESTGKRKLSYGVMLFILINSILGSSLFYLPSLGMKSSGPASLIAWGLLFLVGMLVMLYIAELVTLHPTSGGTYEFCKRAYGKFVSFMAGWLIWIAGNLGMALAIVAAAEYFIPETTSTAFILRMVFSLIWIIALNYMAFRGIDAGATMLVVFGIIAVAVVGLMTLPSFLDIPGLFSGSLGSKFDFGLMKPFFVQEGWGIFLYLSLSLFLICEAFFGFEALSYMANEVEDRKKLSKALLTAMAICGAIILIYIFSSLGTVSYHDYVTDARPFAVQALNNLGELGQKIVVFGMYLVIIGSAAAWPITGSRLIRALAKDKLFLRQFAILHPKHNSPYRAVYFQSVAVGLFSWVIFRGYMKGWADPYKAVYLIFVLLSLIILSLVLMAVPVLRRKEAKLKRLFKAPLPLAGPVFILCLFLFLIGVWLFLETETAWGTIRLASSFIILGIPVYFMISMYYNQKMIKAVEGKLSYLTWFGERFFFPVSAKYEVLKELEKVEELKGKKILEYGCSTGTLTKALAKKVGEKGEIHATDFIPDKVKLTSRAVKKHRQVKVFHHEAKRHFKLRKKMPEVDIIISSGMLANMRNPIQVLKYLRKKLKKGGRIIFVGHDKFFHILPNIPWMKSHEHLKEVFEKAGFSVKVRKKLDLLRSHVIVEGVKK